MNEECMVEGCQDMATNQFCSKHSKQFADIALTGYYNPMECDHNYITIRLPVGTIHGHEMEYGEFCENCHTRLDGIHGIIHYNQKFKYRDQNIEDESSEKLYGENHSYGGIK